MKRRTFTVLFTEEYDEGNGVVMTDQEAVNELRDSLQDAMDYGTISGMFLITNVEDSDEKFWRVWKRHAEGVYPWK